MQHNPQLTANTLLGFNCYIAPNTALQRRILNTYIYLKNKKKMILNSYSGAKRTTFGFYHCIEMRAVKPIQWPRIRNIVPPIV